MRKSLQGAQRDLNNFKSGITSSLKAIGSAFAATKFALDINAAVQDAIKFEAALGQINRLMGTNAKAFQDWANSQASAFGFSRSEAIRYGAVYANLISNFSSGTAETTQRTQELLKATAVIMSNTGRTMEDTLDRIRSGLLGETDAIEDLGINVNVAMLESTKAFQQFANGKSWDQLGFNVQQNILYFGILEQAAKKYGTELAQNTATQQAVFTAQLKDARLALGQFFLPIYNAVLPALTAMAAALANVTRFLAAFSQALFGGGGGGSKAQQQVKTTNAQAKAVSAVGDAYEKAGKQAKGAIAGFDEINLVSDPEAAGAGAAGAPAATAAPLTDAGGGLIDGGAATMEIVSAKAQEMAEKVKAAFNTIKQVILDNKEIIVAALAGIAAGLVTAFVATNWSSIIGGAVTAIGKLSTAVRVLWAAITGPVGLIALAIGALVAAFVYFYQTNEGFRGVVDGILQAIGETAKWLWNEVLVPLGTWLADAFVKSWEAITVAATWLWENVLVPFGDFLLWLWSEVLEPIANVIGEYLALAFDKVSQIAESFWQNVIVPLGNALKEMLGPAIEAVSAVLEFLWKNVFQPAGNFFKTTIMPIIQGLIDIFVQLWESTLKPLANYVGDVFVRAFDGAFKAIGGVIDGVKETFIGLMHFITGVFTGDWKKAWEGVKEIFKGIFDSLWSVVKYPLNLIIDGINALIDGINSLSVDVPKIPGITEGFSLGFDIPKIPKLAKGGITNGPTLAMIGDNPGGQEVVSPLDDLMGMIGTAVTTAIQMVGNRPQGDVVVELDGTQLARVLRPYQDREQQRLGGAAIIKTI